MYEIGTVVIYGSEGACKITEITNLRFGVSSEEAPYYVLSPISNPSSKVFVPKNNEILVSRMQKVLSVAEIKKMISEPLELPKWIKDNRQRNKAFKDILASYDRKQILALARLLHKTKLEGGTEKRLFSSDEEMLKKTTKILHSEFSLVLEIDLEEVIPFIFGEIDCVEK